MKDILKSYIAQKNGMMSISEFMQICLSHPTHGYYMRSDVFGKDGDFTTAPEISQMFGEIIGLWLVDCIVKMPNDPEFNVIEMGPGRGTLMADILRSMAKFKTKFKLHIHMVEMSPKLIEMQREKLAEFDDEISWHSNLDELKLSLNSAPCLFVANEFFDALPIDQYEFLDNAWYQRMVTEKDSEISPTISMKPVEPQLPKILEGRAADGAIFENSPASLYYLDKVIEILQQQRGNALIIDYGHDGHGFGDTLQAVKQHKFAKIFDNLGEQDITAHVNFTALKEHAEQNNIVASPVVTQANFLGDLAIGLRAQMLIRKNPDKELEIAQALHRLIDEEQMGNLFKVLCLQNSEFTAAGFGLE
ncbi:MAG: SAM-dependent methyltransferase [Hyphomicrobiales bacterium]